MPASKKSDDYDVIGKLKEKYAPFQKKYNLPKFDDLDREFKLYNVDEYTTDIMFDIRRQITAVLTSINAYILPILMPLEGEIVSLVESAGVKKDVKVKMNVLFKKIQYFNHKGIAASLKSEKDMVDYVKEIWKDWPSMKKDMAFFADKLTLVWEKEQRSEKEDVGYMG